MMDKTTRANGPLARKQYIKGHNPVPEFNIKVLVFFGYKTKKLINWLLENPKTR